jgi:hypothetical protein
VNCRGAAYFARALRGKDSKKPGGEPNFCRNVKKNGSGCWFVRKYITTFAHRFPQKSRKGLSLNNFIKN